MAVLSDLNLRLNSIPNANSDIMILFDDDCIRQSITRLIFTQQGEIWNYRAYGLDINQFYQYPLSESTARDIENYILTSISSFEPNVTYLDSASQITIDYNNNLISFNLVYQINATGSIIALPAFSIPVSG